VLTPGECGCKTCRYLTSRLGDVINDMAPPHSEGDIIDWSMLSVSQTVRRRSAYAAGC